MPAKKGTSITLQQWCEDNSSTIIDEWVECLDGSLSKEQATTGMHRRVLWRGPCGHEWDSPIYSRVSGKGCPYCHGKKVLMGFNDLESQYPDVAREWDCTKNELIPSETYCGSNHYAYWICNNGHSWRAQIKSRTVDGRGCRFCAGQAPIVGTNDLLTLSPDLAAQWHPVKNGSLKPTDVMPGSNKPAWWKCERGHEWKAVIDSRGLRGNGCPTCAYERKVSVKEKAIVYYLSDFFQVQESVRLPFLKRMELDVFLPEYKIGIEYDGQAFHGNIARDLRKNKLCKDNGITLIRIREPECPQIADCTVIKLGGLGNGDLGRCIRALVETLNKFTGRNVHADVDIDCDLLKIMEKLNMSVKSGSLLDRFPDVASQWHPAKNGDIAPEMISYASNKTVWWRCDKGHEWKADLASRTTGKCGCPFCSGKRVVAGANDLPTLHPEMLKEWDYSKNEKGPETYHGRSHKKVWWVDRFGHSYDMSIDHRVRGAGCPYCSGHRVLVGFNDLQSCFPDVARQWNYSRNESTPDRYTKASNRKVWWVCDNGHEWQASINHRTRGRGCPHCSKRKMPDENRHANL